MPDQSLKNNVLHTIYQWELSASHLEASLQGSCFQQVMLKGRIRLERAQTRLRGMNDLRSVKCDLRGKTEGIKAV